MRNRPEQLIIRPPSEWRSILIRSTRGCNWNRCKFCGIYTALGEPEYSIRPVEDVKQDIDWYAEHQSNLDTAFLGDADPLSRPFDESIEILRYLRERIPHLKRVSAYARSSTLFKSGYNNLKQLKEAGLDRIHTGLESGNKEILKFQIKGQSPKLLVQTGQWIKQAGLELSYYVLLGLGGSDKWKPHIEDSAGILNQTDPDFIRIRRLWIYRGNRGLPDNESPLWKDIRSGTFKPQTPEGTVIELKSLIEQLDGIHSTIVCDHSNNYLRVKGTLPDDKQNMLDEIDEFLHMPEETRKMHYEMVGSEI